MKRDRAPADRRSKTAAPVGERAGAQQHAAHDREDCSIRSNADGQRKDSHSRESRGLSQTADGVTKILPDGFARCNGAHATWRAAFCATGRTATLPQTPDT